MRQALRGQKHFRLAAKIVLCAVFVGLVASLAMSQVYEICGPSEYTHAKECSLYHLPQFIFVWAVAIGDAHNGLITTLASIAVALFTYTLMKLGRGANRHYKVSERAYIKLSHKPPGVGWIGPHNPGYFEVNLQVKNFGRTPGRTIRHYLVARIVKDISEIPEIPGYHNIEPMAAFLVVDDNLVLNCPILLDADEAEAVKASKLKLIVFGFVEYEDRFGIQHRAGYARVYNPLADQRPVNHHLAADWDKRNNLVYDYFPATYNYDRPVSDLPPV